MLQRRPIPPTRRLNLARAGVGIGVALCALSLWALVAAPAKGATQFMPLMTGIPLLFFGVTGLNPHRRRTSVLLSVIVASIAVIYDGARFGQLLRRGGPEPAPMVTFDEWVVGMMALIAAAYLAAVAVEWVWFRRPIGKR